MPSDLEEKVFELKSKVETLASLREEDKERSSTLEDDLKKALSEISSQLQNLQNTNLASDKKMNSRLEALEGVVGKPSETAKRRYSDIWSILEKPIYKQPSFLIGLAALPGILVTGFILGEMDFPKLSYWSHKLLGTHESIVTAFEQDDDVTNATDLLVASAASNPNSKVRGALEVWLDDSDKLVQTVRSQISTEIHSQFSTIAMSQMSVGVADYRPELFAGKDAIFRSQTKVAENIIPVPPQTNVDIYVTLFAQKFDLALIDANYDPLLLTSLDVEEQSEISRRIRPSSVFYLNEMPTLLVNNQQVELEPVQSPDGSMIDDTTPLPMLTTHTFKVSAFETPAANSTIGAAVLRIGISASDLDTGDTEWKYLVTINRSQS